MSIYIRACHAILGRSELIRARLKTTHSHPLDGMWKQGSYRLFVFFLQELSSGIFTLLTITLKLRAVLQNIWWFFTLLTITLKLRAVLQNIWRRVVDNVPIDIPDFAFTCKMSFKLWVAYGFRQAFAVSGVNRFVWYRAKLELKVFQRDGTRIANLTFKFWLSSCFVILVFSLSSEHPVVCDGQNRRARRKPPPKPLLSSRKACLFGLCINNWIFRGMSEKETKSWKGLAYRFFLFRTFQRHSKGYDSVKSVVSQVNAET